MWVWVVVWIIFLNSYESLIASKDCIHLLAWYILCPKKILILDPDILIYGDITLSRYSINPLRGHTLVRCSATNIFVYWKRLMSFERHQVTLYSLLIRLTLLYIVFFKIWFRVYKARDHLSIKNSVSILLWPKAMLLIKNTMRSLRLLILNHIIG